MGKMSCLDFINMNVFKILILILREKYLAYLDAKLGGINVKC